MGLLRIKIVIICSFLSLTSVLAGEMKVVYEDTKNVTEYKIKKELISSDSINSVINLINDNFTLSENIEFFFGSEDGPLYSSEDNKIFIPYSFIKEVEDRFSKVNYDQSGVSSKQATLDALMHTMIHEFAHALIFMYELPVVGKEEDAADALATVLLLEFFNDGAEIAISAADLFDLESFDKQILEEEDFWDEHSLEIKRYYSTLCYVYGSNPKKNINILEDKTFIKQKAEFCIAEYENVSQSWFNLLSPYMKNSSEEIK